MTRIIKKVKTPAGWREFSLPDPLCLEPCCERTSSGRVANPIQRRLDMYTTRSNVAVAHLRAVLDTSTDTETHAAAVRAALLWLDGQP